MGAALYKPQNLAALHKHINHRHNCLKRRQEISAHMHISLAIYYTKKG